MVEIKNSEFEQKRVFKKIIHVNLGIVIGMYFIAFLFFVIFSQINNSQSAISITFPIAGFIIQVAINFILGIIFLFIDTKKAGSFFLSSLIIAIIGFGLCFLTIAYTLQLYGI